MNHAAVVIGLTLLGALLSHGSPAIAQTAATYQPMGAPADPRVPAQWNRYHDHAEAGALLRRLAAAHPGLVRLESIGTSYGGREMWVATITRFRTGPDRDKPGFWIDGGIHANELQGTEVALYTAWFLCEMDGRSPFITRLLDERVFYIAPMISPDSRDAHMREPNSTHSPRSGQRPIDDDQDGRIDEDGADDLDGDGNIVEMRVRDPHGRWKRDAEHPELMVECGPEEDGEFTLLGPEGIDSDGDGEVNEDGDGFYDPNRDWGWGWQPRYVQHGAYRYPFSILENRMVADFVLAHPNLGGAQTYHNAGGMILRGPGARGTSFPGADIAVYDLIGRRGEQMLPGYRYMNIADDLYEVFGGEIDWIYAMTGTLTFTNELWTPFNLFRRKAEGGFFGRSGDAHAFNKWLLFGDGFVAWHEVDHPQYGKVELGGWTKRWIRQPPSFLLEEECHRNMAFTFFHADQMPKVEVPSVEVRELTGGLREVTAVVANPRLIPTRLAHDVQNRITSPDRITLSGGEVLAGWIGENAWFLNAREQKRRPEALVVDSIPGRGVVRVRWLVRGAGPLTVTVVSVKGGRASQTR